MPSPSSRVRQLPQIKLWQVLAPLAAVPFLMTFARAVLNSLLARFENAADELAGYGIGIGLVLLLNSAILHNDQLTLTLGRNRRALRRVTRFTVGMGLCMSILAAAIALVPPLRNLVFVHLQRAPDQPTVQRAAFVLLALSPLGLIDSFCRSMRGALIAAHKTKFVTVAMGTGLGFLILSAVAMFQMPFFHKHPLLLPVIAVFIDAVTRLVLFLWIARKVIWRDLPVDGPVPSLSQILRFQYPLVLTALMMAITRPLINAFLGDPRLAGDPETAKTALAAMTIVFSISVMIYAWLNELRSLPAAFMGSRASLRALRRFGWINGTVITVIMLALFTPPQSGWILRKLVGLDEPDVIRQAIPAMAVFFGFPSVVVLRSYLQGLAIARHETNAMTWSGPARVLATILTLILLSAFGVYGAVIGGAALLAGFAAEPLVIGFFLHRFKNRKQEEKDARKRDADSAMRDLQAEQS